jgi:hypothetical protein
MKNLEKYPKIATSSREYLFVRVRESRCNGELEKFS